MYGYKSVYNTSIINERIRRRIKDLGFWRNSCPITVSRKIGGRDLGVCVVLIPDQIVSES